ncbi:MAG TPA: FxsA family protein [Azospirillum sp.]|nr:FxsA family protein [Azospirillum sp.]
MNPLVFLLLLPIVEIAVLIQIGQWIGAGPTILLVILAAVAGSLLLRRQGLAVLRKAQEAADRGELPVGAVFEGFCVVVGAILLIIPGFVTDVFGILLLMPFLRDALGRWLLERMRRSGTLHVWTTRTGTRQRPPGGQVIDVDYQEVEPDAPRLEESRWRPTPRDRDGHP